MSAFLVTISAKPFCNIVSPALAETKPYYTKPRVIERSAKGWARGLLELLDGEFRQKNIDIYFYRLEYPHEMQDLENLCGKGNLTLPKSIPSSKLLILVVRPRGFEPPTPGPKITGENFELKALKRLR